MNTYQNNFKASPSNDEEPIKIISHPKNRICKGCKRKISFVEMENWKGTKCIHCKKKLT